METPEQLQRQLDVLRASLLARMRELWGWLLVSAMLVSFSMWLALRQWDRWQEGHALLDIAVVCLNLWNVASGLRFLCAELWLWGYSFYAMHRMRQQLHQQ